MRIARRFSGKFQESRILHHTMGIRENFMSIRNEIKEQISCAGFTAQELVDIEHIEEPIDPYETELI